MSENFWKIFVTSGLFAAAVGGMVGLVVTKILPNAVISRANDAAEAAEDLVKKQEFGKWPLAIRCLDTRGEKIYHLNVMDFPSGRIKVSGTSTPLTIVGYRHMWMDAARKNSDDLSELQETQDVEFDQRTGEIVWSNGARDEPLINCRKGATLDVVTAHYREIDR